MCGRGVCVGGGGRAVYYVRIHKRRECVVDDPSFIVLTETKFSIGTHQFSNLYTAVDTPAKAAWGNSPAELLDWPVVGLQKLSKLSV